MEKTSSLSHGYELRSEVGLTIEHKYGSSYRNALRLSSEEYARWNPRIQMHKVPNEENKQETSALRQEGHLCNEKKTTKTKVIDKYTISKFISVYVQLLVNYVVFFIFVFDQ